MVVTADVSITEKVAVTVTLACKVVVLTAVVSVTAKVAVTVT